MIDAPPVDAPPIDAPRIDGPRIDGPPCPTMIDRTAAEPGDTPALGRRVAVIGRTIVDHGHEMINGMGRAAAAS
ncbi:MAG TPA: hypothetical protein VMT69_16745 [Kineosporiaceae bacterium]|nr:hypothetical protein [Kineosporiaceae bacterium]